MPDGDIGRALQIVGAALVGGRNPSAGASAGLAIAEQIRTKRLDEEEQRRQDEFDEAIRTSAPLLQKQLGIATPEEAEAAIRSGITGQLSQFALEEGRQLREEERERAYADAEQVGFAGGGDGDLDDPTNLAARAGLRSGNIRRFEVLSALEADRRKAGLAVDAAIGSDMTAEEKAVALDREYEGVLRQLDQLDPRDQARRRILEELAEEKAQKTRSIVQGQVERTVLDAWANGTPMEGIETLDDPALRVTENTRRATESAMARLQGYSALLDFEDGFVPHRAKGFVTALKAAGGNVGQMNPGDATQAFATLGDPKALLSEAGRNRENARRATEERASAETLVTNLSALDEILGTTLEESYSETLREVTEPGEAAAVFQREIAPQITEAARASPTAAVEIMTTLKDIAPPAVRRTAIQHLELMIEESSAYGESAFEGVRGDAGYRNRVAMIRSGLDLAIDRSSQREFVRVPVRDRRKMEEIRIQGFQALDADGGDVIFVRPTTRASYDTAWKRPVKEAAGQFHVIRDTYSQARKEDLDARESAIAASIDSLREFGQSTEAAQGRLIDVQKEQEKLSIVDEFHRDRMRQLGRLAYRMAAQPDPDSWQEILTAGQSSLTQEALSTLSNILPSKAELDGLEPHERVTNAIGWLAQHAKLTASEADAGTRRALSDDLIGYGRHLEGLYLDMSVGWSKEKEEILRSSEGAPKRGALFKAARDDEGEIALLGFLHNALL